MVLQWKNFDQTHTRTKRRTPSPQSSPVKLPSVSEIYAWTFTADSTAACTIKDVLDLEQKKVQGHEWYQIGRVPCRSVKVVGMVVGVQGYEKRTLYSVDDGTSVIDCAHMHRPQPLKSPQSTTNYHMPEFPAPLANVGKLVEVIGQVREGFATRYLQIDTIRICSCPDEELHHLLAVRKFRLDCYKLDTPFIIPPTKDRPTSTTPVKYRAQTPSTIQSSPPSSIASSPVKPSVTPEMKQTHHPPRILDPSRLRSGNLTENTFRIYLKHYMDNEPILEDHDDSDEDVFTSRRNPLTPIKRPRINQPDTTPRNKTTSRVDATPKARKIVSSSSGTIRKGFTLSYLRRVPALATLASRVVRAIAKRKERETRKALKEMGAKPSSKSRSRISRNPEETTAAKIKSLFQHAINELLREGGIALWLGPTRPTRASMDEGASCLWKSNATIAGESNFSRTEGTLTSSDLIEEEDVLSDPSPQEEAYISITPEYLAEPVEQAIRSIVEKYEKQGRPYHGCSLHEIMSFLRRDDMWQYVGEWTVTDSLTVLENSGRALRSLRGRWDVTTIM